MPEVMPWLKFLWLPLAFVAAFFMAGMSFWEIPYHDVNVPDSLIGPALIGLAALSMALTIFKAASWRKIVIVMSLCLPAVVYARVEVEIARDPATHNLWPLEVIAALILGAGCVMAGVAAGAIIKWLRNRAA